MKKSELIKIIRAEIYDILADVLPSALSEIVAEEIHNPRIQQPAPVKEQVRRKPIFSSNSPLAEILNETEGGIDSMGDGMVTFEEQPEFSTDNFNIPSVENLEFAAGEHGQRISLDELREAAPGVADALTRDYSSLLKAADQKARASGPSNINFNQPVNG